MAFKVSLSSCLKPGCDVWNSSSNPETITGEKAEEKTKSLAEMLAGPGTIQPLSQGWQPLQTSVRGINSYMFKPL